MSVIGEEEVRGSKAIFKEISADDEDQQPTVIESLCMSCFENVRRYVLDNIGSAQKNK